MRRRLLFITLFAAVWPTPARAGEPLTFPADAGLVDVRDFGAVPDDGKDDTAAIQRAFVENSGNGSVIYLPPGEFMISDTIQWPGRQSFNALYGSGQAHTTLRLIDRAPGFGDAGKPKNMIWTGGPPAQRFRNHVRDLTIDCGTGNPGAVGLNFCANNQGGVFDVTIRSGVDGGQPGAVGLGLDQPEVGPLLVRKVTVIGFDVGVRVRHSVNSVTLEHVTLRGQRKAGIDNYNNYVFVRKLDSDNAVPAIVNAGPEAIVTVIDSKLRGSAAAGLPAIVNSAHSTLFVRDVEASGYGEAVRPGAGEAVPAGHVEEWVSGPRLGLFPGELTTLDLPVVETPTVPHDPLEQWVSPARYGGLPGDGKDDTQAIQQAIDSGATTVYLPRGKELPPSQRAGKKQWNGAYLISDTIHIRGIVRRIVGLEATLEVSKALRDQPDKPVFVFEDGSPPAVVFERLRFTFGHFDNPMIVHRAPRDLVIASFSGLHGPRHEGPGRLFLDDTVGNGYFVGPGATLYARQLNPEGSALKFINGGGTLWVLGLKTEARSPIGLTQAGGATEIIGGHLYKCVKGGIDAVAFEVEEGGRMSLAGVAEYCWTPDWATQTLVRETRGGETRVFNKEDLPARGNAGNLPLLACFPAAARGSSPGLPRVSAAEQTAASVTLALEADDPDGDIAGFVVTRDGTPLGRHRHAIRERGLRPDTSYTYNVAAYDRFGNTSPAASFAARTTPDTTPPTSPANLRTLNVTDQRVELNWQRSQDELGVAGYVVERVAAGGEARALATVPSTEFADDAVAKGSGYTYRITAVDAAGNRSAPAILEVATLAHAPRQIKQEAERYAGGHGNIKKGWFLFNLHEGCWMIYPDLELGRETPFDEVTIRCGAPADRAGAIVEIVVDPLVEVVGDQRRLVGGEVVGRLVVESTGGWESFKEFTLPIRLARPGRRDVALRIERGDARHPNALVNIDWFALGYASPATGR